DRSNLHALRQIAPHLGHRMHLFRSFDPEAETDEVPDPYGRSDAAFDDVIGIVRSGARPIVKEIGDGRLP
ncbi:MAG: low molecular weight phosphotyrosine protein phosphatase, partial [Actinomycetota bacterium]